MRTSSIHRHRVDIHSLDDLAEASGLTVREIQTSLADRQTNRVKACKRMVSACIDDAILSRCSTFIIQVLNGQTLSEPFNA